MKEIFTKIILYTPSLALIVSGTYIITSQNGFGGFIIVALSLVALPDNV
jgi:hypothetical protein